MFLNDTIIPLCYLEYFFNTYRADNCYLSFYRDYFVIFYNYISNVIFYIGILTMDMLSDIAIVCLISIVVYFVIRSFFY